MTSTDDYWFDADGEVTCSGFYAVLEDFNDDNGLFPDNVFMLPGDTFPKTIRYVQGPFNTDEEAQAWADTYNPDNPRDTND